MSPKYPLASVLAAAALCVLAPPAQAAPGDPPVPQADAQRSADADSAAAARASERTRQQLEAARRRLEEAAREVAELSVRGLSYGPGEIPMPSRSIIGVQVELSDDVEGLRVQSVSPGGPAEEAGVRPGDVITAINGVDVRGREQGRTGLRALARLKPESRVSLKLLRDGKPLDITVTTRAAPAGMAAVPIPAVPRIPPIAVSPIPPVPSIPDIVPYFAAPALANLELATLTPQLGHYFGTERGVLVVRAPDGGALGLKDGDVILSIDGREAASSSHVTRILSSYQSGEKVTLQIIRDHKPLTLTATLPARQAGAHPHRYSYEVPPQGWVDPQLWPLRDQAGPGAGAAPREQPGATRSQVL